MYKYSSILYNGILDYRDNHMTYRFRVCFVWPEFWNDFGDTPEEAQSILLEKIECLSPDITIKSIELWEN